MTKLRDTVTKALATYQTIQNPDELVQLLQLVFIQKPKTVVELGVFRGGTLFCWTSVAHPEARIVGIDTPGTPHQLDKDLASWLQPPQQGLIIRGDTNCERDRDKTLSFLQAPIDFLFIDAAHTYGAVKRDWELWSPHVRKGGIVGFHDICYSKDTDPSVQVWKFWQEEIQTKFTTRVIIAPEKPYGIGVVFV